MKTTPVLFVAVIVALVALGLFVANYAYAGQVSLLSTSAVSGVSVVPVHGYGGWHGHRGWYGRRYYGGWYAPLCYYGRAYYGGWAPGYVNPGCCVY